MAGFDANELVRRLRSAETSVTSIQGTSKWIAARPQAVKEIVSAWERDFEAQPVSKWLLYLYVANDVVQTTKQKSGALFKDAFFGALCRTMAKSLLTGDRTLEAKTERMINVWEERRIMSPSEIRILRDIHASRGRSVPPNLQTPGASSGSFGSGIGGHDASAGSSGKDEVDIEAEVARAAATVRDTFENELASTDEEGADNGDQIKTKPVDDGLEDPVVVAEEVREIVEDAEGSTALGGGGADAALDLDDQGLGEREAKFVSLAETVEFEMVGDTLAMEKVEKLSEMLRKLEKGLANEEIREDEDPAKADDNKYETVRIEQKLSLEFRTAHAVLEAGKKRSASAKERNEKLSEACEGVLENSANAMDSARETLLTMDTKRKELRALARVVFLETNRRKRKRICDDRRAELEAQAKERSEASTKSSTASRMEDFLSSMKTSLNASYPSAPRRKPAIPPPLPAIPPAGPGSSGMPGGLPPIPPPGAPPIANRMIPPIPPAGPPPSRNARGDYYGQ
ncbi:Regulation of nuclear pre-mRNA domain-containing protein 1B [Hondaea fermentalgiana]|uniref:Regulation of nuclear pre-mRNA domain-containing protein 1B n=1 Tax=Hondaea fermentalgiana TaxID=2315210 RepID=A0A2R5GMQ9_9STRA|nr:Regulation of nuclear pre-mRNA domain-containing protein 1B [Hondaea fermentalgiana]|eukprot:GBG32182.1 Regulation of nuclear pre-mRNA domain-containing protein 1B [Hondaea fermentalgiana]